MMRYIQARRHLRSSDKILAPDEDKLPRSRPGALISQTLLHCIVEKKKRENIQVLESTMLQKWLVPSY